METYYIIIIITALIFSGIFSGVEIAFVSADKLHIELKSKQGVGSARTLSNFINNSSRFIATTLVGNTIALVIYGIYMAKLLEPVIAGYLPQNISKDILVPLIQTVLATIIVLITAEFTPKSLFLLNPNRMLKLFAPLLKLIYWVLFPLVWVMINVSRFIIEKILRLEYSEDKPVFGLIDLNNYIKNVLNSATKEDDVDVNAKIFTNALEFKTVRVRECMIPRTEIAAVEIEDSIENLKSAFVESGHSKILVYKDSIDDIIGYCHSLKLFTKPDSISKILTPIPIAPETMMANELMIQLITEHKSLALVVDEFGGTSGIVSIEDIIEEIFGEIKDEHDDEDLVEQKLDNQTYLLSARHEIDYLNEQYQWDIPEGDYDTLGGYILSETENIPDVNEIIDLNAFTFKIVSKEDTHIETVKIYIKSPNDDN
ncbi:hemolysin family protein [Fulvivirgaceae bacterium BMA12]|uniref:Hemolysin family protein n=1 Tax=Agaribacillus aureus TaxID=3051825 RepID=A0ABT8LGN6_9BACT|nr:hemolysin family protein [Fulvivirgaceae bacterium BMA12]